MPSSQTLFRMLYDKFKLTGKDDPATAVEILKYVGLLEASGISQDELLTMMSGNEHVSQDLFEKVFYKCIRGVNVGDKRRSIKSRHSFRRYSSSVIIAGRAFPRPGNYSALQKHSRSSVRFGAVEDIKGVDAEFEDEIPEMADSD